MKKNILIAIAVVALLLVGSIAWLATQLKEQKRENRAIQELVELDKQDMENEYEQFARQYSELKTQINNDSLLAQLSKEQLRTQELLKELQQVKNTDAAEITRLKKELSVCREVIRSYVLEVDSLCRLNQNLQAENKTVKEQLEASNRQVDELNANNEDLSQRVAVAAQLDAVNLQLKLIDRRGLETKSISKAKELQVNFTLAKNVTAQSGLHQIYARIQTPTGTVLTEGKTFQFENRMLQYSMKKQIVYNGKDTPVTMYWKIKEYLGDGTYLVSIFDGGSLIGSSRISIN